MPKTRPAYPPEYRGQIIALARSGRTPEDLAMAVSARRPGPGLIHHSDQGSQGGFN